MKNWGKNGRIKERSENKGAKTRTWGLRMSGFTAQKSRDGKRGGGAGKIKDTEISV